MATIRIMITTTSYIGSSEGYSFHFLTAGYSVLVHSGSGHQGHYYACISPNPSKSPATSSDWFKFDDDFISAIPQKSAVNDHYGGVSFRANAYVLVYIQRNRLDETLCEMKVF